MAMMLFTVFNGLGVVFLLYVLVQFWKEGRRSMEQAAGEQGIEFSRKIKPTVHVVTRPISGGLDDSVEAFSLELERTLTSQVACRSCSVTPREARMRGTQNGPGVIFPKRFSAR